MKLVKTLIIAGLTLGTAGTVFAQDVVGAAKDVVTDKATDCLLYTSPSPRDRTRSRMPSSA